MIHKTIKSAAKGCYYPTQDREKQCMAWIIECLVFPPDCHGFTDEDMEIYIDEAIKKLSVRKLPDYDKVKKEEEAYFLKKS